MSKVNWKQGTFVYPVPAILVSCGTMEKPNVLTVAWTGTINSDPAMTYISVRKERYSHNIIASSKEFVINLTNKELAFATDYCGVKSGKNENKIENMNLHLEKCNNINTPMIKESPVSIECKVTEIKELGSHDMFMAEVLSINVDEKYLDEDNKFDLEKANLIAYSHGQYYCLGERIGKFGFSVEKKK
jgi:Conserved protein/domain typically associated with flavoprotein oxygenases, DIM6/NTAB family